MVEVLKYKLDDALIAFAKSKLSEGGIYSKDCLDLLQAQTNQVIANYKPETPKWDTEYEKVPKNSKPRVAETTTTSSNEIVKSSSPTASSITSVSVTTENSIDSYKDEPLESSSSSSSSLSKNENDKSKISEQKDIPPGWIKVWSEREKRNYYYNQKTKESKWEIPKS